MDFLLMCEKYALHQHLLIRTRAEKYDLVRNMRELSVVFTFLLNLDLVILIFHGKLIYIYLIWF